MVSIIDYGMGNLFSVKQACKNVGLNAVITNDKNKILNSSAAILPGVGAFSNAMEYLHKLDLINTIVDFVESGRKFMGICLGMQLLFSESEEFGRNKGLGIISGSVMKFPTNDNQGNIYKVPQVGWNKIRKLPDVNDHNQKSSPLRNIRDEEFMYFVHSYYCKPTEYDISLSTTEYAGIEYCSSVLKDNVFAAQFHPEKSGKEGLRIYKDWAESIVNSCD